MVYIVGKFLSVVIMEISYRKVMLYRMKTVETDPMLIVRSNFLFDPLIIADINTPFSETMRLILHNRSGHEKLKGSSVHDHVHFPTRPRHKCFTCCFNWMIAIKSLCVFTANLQRAVELNSPQKWRRSNPLARTNLNNNYHYAL